MRYDDRPEFISKKTRRRDIPEVRRENKTQRRANTMGFTGRNETPPPPNQEVELGTIRYVNLTDDGGHGDIAKALSASQSTGKPIFANFVEWSG